jgi:GDPmannose 4,6-dehydratase
VTRKITRGLARVVHGLQDCLFLGNLDAKRDWGHARDYVLAQWMMLQQESPDDFVIATGEQHSVREFVEIAGREAGVRIGWSGTGLDERASISRRGAWSCESIRGTFALRKSRRC